MKQSVVGIVDPHVAVSTDVATALGRAGYTPRTAHTFGDAIAMMTLVEPAAMVVSLELGAYNGLHVLLRTAVDYPATRVIVVGPASAPLEDEARALGAAAYIARPVSADALVDVVNSVLLAPPAAAGPAVVHVRHV
jgi:ActR/RegA family two-component response regulator